MMDERTTASFEKSINWHIKRKFDDPQQITNSPCLN